MRRRQGHKDPVRMRRPFRASAIGGMRGHRPTVQVLNSDCQHYSSSSAPVEAASSWLLRTSAANSGDGLRTISLSLQGKPAFFAAAVASFTNAVASVPESENRVGSLPGLSSNSHSMGCVGKSWQRRAQIASLLASEHGRAQPDCRKHGAHRQVGLGFRSLART